MESESDISSSSSESSIGDKEQKMEVDEETEYLNDLLGEEDHSESQSIYLRMKGMLGQTNNDFNAGMDYSQRQKFPFTDYKLEEADVKVGYEWGSRSSLVLARHSVISLNDM